MRITIPGYKPRSWNQFYAGGHWTKRKAAADEAHMLVRAALPADVELYAVPVDITVTAHFRGKAMDADNIAAKLLIDGLVGRVLVDDSPEYVRSVRTVSAVDKAAPRVVIDVVPVGGGE